MKLIKFKTSTLCAGVSFLVLGSFMAVNLAGCGGGGGGGLGGGTATPVTINATITPRLSNGSAAPAGTVTLTRSGVTLSQAITGGAAVFSGLSAGLYDVSVTITDSSGGVLENFFISGYQIRSDATSYTIQQSDGSLKVSGKIYLNPNSGDETSRSIAACTTDSSPVTAQVRVSVRDLNSALGNPIISQVVRAVQDPDLATAEKGKYSVSVPYRPTSFQVEVSQAYAENAVFSGRRGPATFTPGATEIANVDVCANDNDVVPGPAPTPTLPVPTPTVTRTTAG